MSHGEHDDRPWIDLNALAAAGDAERLDAYLEELAPGEAARALSRLPADERLRVLTTLTPEDAADLMEEIPDAQAGSMIEQLPAAQAAEIVAEMSSAEQADLLHALDDDDAQSILAAMTDEDATEARRLAVYDDEVAGGLMLTEFLSYPDDHTARDVIDDLRANAEAYSDYDVQYVYIVGDDGGLTGVLRLRDLVLAPASRRVVDMMIASPLSVADETPLDGLADFFDRHAFVGVPVVDTARNLVGVVRRHDVEEALAGRSDQDFLKSQGIVGGEELRTMPLMRRSSRRLSWLSINIVLNMIAASIIAYYEDTLSSVIALAMFLPIISDMSGCSGNQAVAVSMRELALGIARPADALRVWGKEVSVGLVNGLALGVLLGVASWLLKGNAWLGLVVGGALAVNTVVAVSIGGTVPLLLKRLRFDPALASGPILTTVTDMFGFFLALFGATLLMDRIQGT